MSEAAAVSMGSSIARDVIDLAKPRVTALVLATSALGVWSAPSRMQASGVAVFLAGVGLIVASANTLNCWLERESDARMIRTRKRALPAGRLRPGTAVAIGALEAAVGLPLLALGVNGATALLAAIAHAIYVMVYTPLKRVTPWALPVGAVPGAIPPLMGWTAAEGALGTPGWVLFALLFFWQLPHFIAITLYLHEDYRRGGLRVLSVAAGEPVARRLLVATAVAACVTGIALGPLGLGGPLYAVAATVLGLGFVALAWHGARRALGAAWARRTFLYSIVYLVGIVTALLAEGL